MNSVLTKLVTVAAISVLLGPNSAYAWGKKKKPEGSTATVAAANTLKNKDIKVSAIDTVLTERDSRITFTLSGNPEPNTQVTAALEFDDQIRKTLKFSEPLNDISMQGTVGVINVSPEDYMRLRKTVPYTVGKLQVYLNNKPVYGKYDPRPLVWVDGEPDWNCKYPVLISDQNNTLDQKPETLKVIDNAIAKFDLTVFVISTSGSSAKNAINSIGFKHASRFVVLDSLSNVSGGAEEKLVRAYRKLWGTGACIVGFAGDTPSVDGSVATGLNIPYLAVNQNDLKETRYNSVDREEEVCIAQGDTEAAPNEQEKCDASIGFKTVITPGKIRCQKTGGQSWEYEDKEWKKKEQPKCGRKYEAHVTSARTVTCERPAEFIVQSPKCANGYEYVKRTVVDQIPYDVVTPSIDISGFPQGSVYAHNWQEANDHLIENILFARKQITERKAGKTVEESIDDEDRNEDSEDSKDVEVQEPLPQAQKPSNKPTYQNSYTNYNNSKSEQVLTKRNLKLELPTIQKSDVPVDVAIYFAPDKIRNLDEQTVVLGSVESTAREIEISPEKYQQLIEARPYSIGQIVFSNQTAKPSKNKSLVFVDGPRDWNCEHPILLTDMHGSLNTSGNDSCQAVDNIIEKYDATVFVISTSGAGARYELDRLGFANNDRIMVLDNVPGYGNEKAMRAFNYLWASGACFMGFAGESPNIEGTAAKTLNIPYFAINQSDVTKTIYEPKQITEEYCGATTGITQSTPAADGSCDATVGFKIKKIDGKVECTSKRKVKEEGEIFKKTVLDVYSKPWYFGSSKPTCTLSKEKLNVVSEPYASCVRSMETKIVTAVTGAKSCANGYSLMQRPKTIQVPKSFIGPAVDINEYPKNSKYAYSWCDLKEQLEGKAQPSVPAAQPVKGTKP